MAVEIAKRKEYLVIWIAAAMVGCLFFVFHYCFRDFVPDPDTFYHLKVAQLFWQDGPLRWFPWNYYTIFSDTYMDHHFLYHVILSPFVSFGNAFFGLTVFLALQVSVFFGCFLLLIRSLTKKLWVAVTFSIIPVFLSHQFLFQLNVGRSIIVSIIILMGAIAALIYRRPWLLGIISSLYVLAYNAFPLVVILFLVHSFACVASKQKIYWKGGLAIAIGLLVGILVHPNFPDNLSFYWTHIVQIGLFPPDIPLGMGWNRYPIFDFITDNIVVLIVWITGMVLAYRDWKSFIKNVVGYFLLFVSLVFFVAALKSILYVVYWVPFAILFAAYTVSQHFSQDFRIRVSVMARQYWQIPVGLAMLMLFFAGLSFFSINTVKGYLESSPKSDLYKGAAAWMMGDSQKGDIVFNTQWDQFPQLFYWNDENYYIVGMDPTFMYEHDQGLYWKWRSISDDDPSKWENGNLYKIIKNDFKSRYIFLENDRNPNLKKQLDAMPAEFALSYSDEKTSVYMMKD